MFKCVLVVAPYSNDFHVCMQNQVFICNANNVIISHLIRFNCNSSLPLTHKTNEDFDFWDHHIASCFQEKYSNIYLVSFSCQKMFIGSNETINQSIRK